MSKRIRTALRYKNARRFWRRFAPLFIAVFAWSSTLATGAQALALNSQLSSLNSQLTGPHTRHLTPDEMRGIRGASTSIPASPGSTFPWEGSVGGINTADGNKLTSIPIVGWTNKGGMPVDLTLYHNSQGSRNSELGQKWSFSFNAYATVDGSGNVTVHWGDDLAYTFTKNMGGSYTAPAGIYDTLVSNGSPITSYDLTNHGQIKYHFTNPNSTGWFLATITDLNSNTITVNRNGSNQVTSVVDSSSRTLTFTYTSNRITSISDAQSRSWSITYNGSGELTQITWPTVSGNTYNQQFAYDGGGHHDIVTYTDRRGKNWTFTYNSSDDSIATQSDPLSNQTSFSYSSGTTTITDANSNASTHTYNTTTGQHTASADPLSNSESYSYDSSYNKTGMTDKRGKSWSWTYDSSGNVLTATDPLSHTTTWTYNSKNRMLTQVCSVGDKVVNTYDVTLTWNLTKTELKDASNTVLSTTNYTYNGDGTLATKQDSNSHTTSYGYNSNGHLTSVTTPNSRVTGFGVNTLGVRTSRTDALSRTTNYTLDNWNRCTAILYPNSTNRQIAYNAESAKTLLTDVNGTIGWTYDNAGRILTETGGGNTYITYTWDANGQKGLLATVTDKANRTVTYSYTTRNQIYQVAETAGTATYGYDANGNETSATLQNTSTVAKVYDDANRLTSATNKNSGGTTLSSFSYSYANDDLISSCTESNGDVVSYGYDAAHRLTSESRTGSNSYSYTFTLDGTGNRTSEVIGGTTTNFNYSNDDELTSTTGGIVNSYSYNSNGEQTNRTLSGTSYTLTYDYDGMLSTVTQGGNTVTYAYDAIGRRFYRKDPSNNMTRYLWATNGILEESLNGVMSAQYSIGNEMIRRNTEYPMFDGHGSERTICNGSQTVTGTAIYDGFGQTVATTGSSSNPYMYAGNSGYSNTNDAGLMYVGARYYDAQMGRFITRDTELDQHPYLYCEHDPVNNLDPSGNFPIFAPWLFQPPWAVTDPPRIHDPGIPREPIKWYWHEIPVVSPPGTKVGIFLPYPDPRYYIGRPEPPFKDIELPGGGHFSPPWLWGPPHSRLAPWEGGTTI